MARDQPSGSSEPPPAERERDGPPSQDRLEPRALSLLVAVRFWGLLADQMATYLLPVAVYMLTRDAALSGIAFTVQWLPRVVSLPFLGAMVDRFPALSQLLLADLVRAAAVFLLFFWHSPAAIIGVSGLLTLFNGHALIATESLVARKAPSEAISGTQAKIQSAQQLSMVLGPALSGGLLVWPGLEGGFVVVAGVFALTATVTVAAFSTIGTTATASAPSLEPVLSRMKSGLLGILRTPLLRLLLALTIVVNLVGALALAALPPIVAGGFGAPDSLVGVVAGTGSAVSLAAAVGVNLLVRKVAISRLVPGAFAMLLVAAPLLGLAPDVYVFTAAFGVWSGGITVFVIWMRTRRLDLLPPQEVGSGLGFFVAAVLVASPLAGLLLSAFGGRTDPQSLLLGTAAVSALSACLIGVAWHRHLRRAEGRPRPGDISPTNDRSLPAR